ncbi:MAG: hypothetical protein C0605_07780 [Hyphomicrobiales bacterium]|nr:MAG: hypothetical protein C0605_07780 [Hyphomicrobiales bacterium]
MTREQLIKTLKKEARKAGVRFEIDTKKGKGSHYRVKYGNRVSTIQSGELSPLHVKTIRRQLGLK